MELKKTQSPVIALSDCSAAFGFFMPDRSGEFKDLKFVPLRTDYVDDAYKPGNKLGLCLGITVGGRFSMKSGMEFTKEIEPGAILYLLLKPSPSMRGGLNNQRNMANTLESMFGTKQHQLIWKPSFSEESAVIDGKPVRYARLKWEVSEPESDTEKELIQLVGKEYEESPTFENLCSFNNEILLQYQQSAQEMMRKNSGTQAQLPQTNQQALPEAQSQQ